MAARVLKNPARNFSTLELPIVMIKAKRLVRISSYSSGEPHFGGKAVAVKTEAQQAVLALHRMRQQLVKFRTMQINSIRGLLTEYDEVMAKGRSALDKAWSGPLKLRTVSHLQ
ncbi:transposase [Paraburkholderia sp. JPY465]